MQERLKMANLLQLARECCLTSNYEASLEYYEAVSVEIVNFIEQESVDEDLCSSWRLIQMQIMEEMSSVHEIVDELKCLTDLAEEVRRERRMQKTQNDFDIRKAPPHLLPAAVSVQHKSPSWGLGPSRQHPRRKFDTQNSVESPCRRMCDKVPSRTAAPVRTPSKKTLLRQGFRGGPIIVSPPRTRDLLHGEVGSDAKRSCGKDLPKSTKKVSRFVPRVGEEELVQLIETEMYAGKLSVSWTDIAGLEEAKHLLEEAVVYPLLMPDYYTGIRRPWKGVLLYGPPGTGKTMLAKAVASEAATTFFNISPATLTSKWRGESEKLIRVLFEMARHYAPSTIFIDEIDSLCGERGASSEHEATRRSKGTLLAEMDGVGVDPSKVVMVLGATNHPWDIDEAMRRRLEKRIYIPLPNLQDRVELFKINTRSLKLSPDVDFEKLSQLLEGHYYSGADITNLVRDAAMMTMRHFMRETDKRKLLANAAEIGRRVAEQPISMQDFLSAFKKVPSSISPENIQKFDKWKSEFEINS